MKPKVTPEAVRAFHDSELIEQINKFEKARPLTASEIDFDPAEVDMFGLTRRISKQKGSWYQVAKDLKQQ